MKLDVGEIWIGCNDVLASGPKKCRIISDVTLEASNFAKGDNEQPRMDYILHIEDDSKIGYRCRLNATSTYLLLKAWGNETTKWIGKMVELTTDKIKGKPALIVRPIV